MIVKETSVLLCYDVCLCYVFELFYFNAKECAIYVLLIYMFRIISYFITTAPDMFSRETCDEIKWCKNGGKFFL